MRLFGGKLRKSSHNYRRNGGYGGWRREIGGGKVLWGVNAYAQSMLWSSVLKTVGAVLFGRNVRHSERFNGFQHIFRGGNRLGCLRRNDKRLRLQLNVYFVALHFCYIGFGTGVLQAKNEQLNLI